MQYFSASLMILIYLTSQRSFVDTAPAKFSENVAREDNLSQVDKNVKELESLKQSFGKLGKTLDLIKSQSSELTNLNGEKQLHSETKEEIQQDGQTVAKVSQNVETLYEKNKPRTKIKTQLDVPVQGVHKTILQSLPEDDPKKVEMRRSSSNLNLLTDVDKGDTNAGIRYSPLDVAKYIFWTGDEKGVTSSIEEFLREDIMTGEEALTFLQEVKYNLDKLKNRYIQMGLSSLQNSKITDDQPLQLGLNTKLTVYDKPELRSDFNIKQLRKEIDNSQTVSRSNIDSSQSAKTTEEDYDELLERLRVADFLYTEYSLEDVIYQLAKVMFTQSLTRGSAEAQQALQKFTNFLEAEAEQGHITRALEKKVLDILIASLSDTLNEHPELLIDARNSMGPSATPDQGHNFIRKVLKSNLENTSLLDLYEYKENAKNKLLEQKKNKFPNYLQFDFSKYKLT
ncbi:uncharacterized protein LOC130442531 isoform X2 [Diorhabda sublineata]|uniref:uncharacterized protein LOC130442531 isoform X2 n=1 Tax=Diorhabda sublineata TaxID=1163346 RepID=UPI0024E0FEB5|nr:uncharacterized protein LOC130442531 isoform X2 [Diorhabda sublineata]